MIQEKLALTGAVAAPVGAAVNWLTTMTDVMQVIVLLASAFAGFASGIYYVSKWLRERNDSSNR